VGLRCTADDHFAGFGAQTWGVDARGETIPIWMQEEGVGKDLTTDDPTGIWFVVGRRHSSYMPLPEFLAKRGYVAVAETAHRSTFALCSEQSDVARMELELPVTLDLFYGPDPHDALSRATAHFGRPRVPPAFAFAPWNDAILGSDNVRRVATKLRTVGAPSSVIWTEDWRGGTWSGDNYTLKEEWDVDRTLYPDFEAVAADLHGGGFKWLVYFNSFVEGTARRGPRRLRTGISSRRQTGRRTPSPTPGSSRRRCRSHAAGRRGVAVGKMKAAIALERTAGWGTSANGFRPTPRSPAAPASTSTRATRSSGRPRSGRPSTSPSRPTAWSVCPSCAPARLARRPSPTFSGAGDQRTDFEADDGLPTVVPIGIGVGLGGMSTFGSDIAATRARPTRRRPRSSSSAGRSSAPGRP